MQYSCIYLVRTRTSQKQMWTENPYLAFQKGEPQLYSCCQRLCMAHVINDGVIKSKVIFVKILIAYNFKKRNHRVIKVLWQPNRNEREELSGILYNQICSFACLPVCTKNQLQLYLFGCCRRKQKRVEGCHLDI